MELLAFIQLIEHVMACDVAVKNWKYLTNMRGCMRVRHCSQLQKYSPSTHSCLVPFSYILQDSKFRILHVPFVHQFIGIFTCHPVSNM